MPRGVGFLFGLLGEEVADVLQVEAAVCVEAGIGGVLGDVVYEGVDEGEAAEELGDGEGGEFLTALIDAILFVFLWSEV